MALYKNYTTTFMNQDIKDFIEEFHGLIYDEESELLDVNIK